MNKLNRRRLLEKISKNKIKYFSIFTLVFVLLLGFGYAALNTSLLFNGNARLEKHSSDDPSCEYPSGTLTADYTVNSSYGSNPVTYNVNLAINNNGDSNLQNFKIIIIGPNDLDMLETAFIDSYTTDNGTLTLTPTSWASTIAAGSNQNYNLYFTTTESKFSPTIYVDGCRVYGDGGGSPTQKKITGLSFQSDSYNLAPNDTKTLALNITPSGATGTITWTSSNTNVARVSKGVVTAVAEGTATITASSGNISTTCTINVSNNIIKITNLAMNKTTATMNTGENLQLSYTKQPANATSTVEWSSSNPSVATVDSSGLVTAIDGGTVTIYATSNDISTECNIEVELSPLSNLEFPTNEVTLSIGESQTLNLTKTPSSAIETITWTSSNPTIATVDSNGLVTGIKQGTTTITASSGNISATCNITIDNSGASQTSIVPTTGTVNVYGQDIHISVNIANNSDNNVSYFRIILDIPDDSKIELWTGPEYTVSNGIIIYEKPSWSEPLGPGKSMSLNFKVTIPEGYNANDYSNPNITIIGVE